MNVRRNPGCRLTVTGVLIACDLVLPVGARSRAQRLTNVEIDLMGGKNPAALLGIRVSADTLLDSAKVNP